MELTFYSVETRNHTHTQSMSSGSSAMDKNKAGAAPNDGTEGGCGIPIFNESKVRESLTEKLTFE